jgi:hypothetical protein
LLLALTNRGWVRGRVLAAELDLDDRAIRELAHRSRGSIVSGQKGYRLTVEATIGEVDHAVSWMLSQATAMRQRALEIQRVRHGRQRNEERAS